MRELLFELQKSNIHVSLDGFDLKVKFDGDKLPDHLIEKIKRNKEQIISYLKSNVSIGLGFTSISRTENQPNYLLSSSQRRLWVLSQFEESNVAYNMPGVYEFEGNLDLTLLEKSFQSLINRHEILRTVFKEDDKGEPKQYILSTEDLNFKIGYVDLQKESNQEEQLSKYTLQDFSKPFSLQQGPLLRASIYQLRKDKYIFTYVMHHIISDSWSMNVLVKEALAFYNAYSQKKEADLKPLSINYKDYAAWQQSQLQEDSLQNHKAYWLEQFKGELPVLELPTDKPRPSIKTNKGGSITKTLNPSTSKSLNTLCQSTGSTLYMGLLASINTLLYKYSNQEDIIVGSSTAGREHTDLEDQIGCYANTLVLRSQFKGENSFKELLEQTKAITLGAYEHQMYPFDELVDELGLQRDMSRNPLFDVVVVFQNNESQSLEALKLGDVTISPYSQLSDYSSSKFDLTFTFVEIGSVLQLSIEYNSDLYYKRTIDRLVVHYEALLSSIVENPNQSLNQLNYIGEQEKHQLLIDFNNTKVSFPQDKTIIDLFEEQVKKIPNNIALVFDGKKLTYKELNERSNQLANHLINTYAIKPNDLVGVMLDRSDLMLIAILGVLKSGGAYVPIDPEYPKERIDYMLKDSNVILLVTQTSYLFVLDYYNGPIFGIDVQLENIAFGIESPKLLNQAKHLAYVIYTSGSTGKPKGVMIEHWSIANTIQSQVIGFDLHEGEKALQFASLSFDVSVWEIFLCLTSGGELYIIGDMHKKNSSLFEEFITHNSIEIATLPPAYLKLLNIQNIKTLKKVITAGEAAHASIAIEYSLHGTYFNAYGPTESSICASFYKVQSDFKNMQNVPIGHPIANTQLYIINKRDGLQPIGVIGEICIGGDGLARGYLNKEELTAEKFVNNPFKPGERMYKTGDLGRWLHDGNIEFIGRLDDQVKIRGYRIELGEIESALNKYNQVTSSVVVTKTNKEGEKDLVAYVVSKGLLNAQDLRNYLGKLLPVYMVPGYFVQLESIPLNTNGKIDKKQLPSPEEMGLSRGVDYVAPRNEAEEKLVKIWEEILDRKNIGIKDNFFELGGHSLKVTRLISKIQKVLNTRLELKDLYTQPVLEQQAILLQQTIQTTYQHIPKVSNQSSYSLSSSQRRLWVLSQFAESNVAYNMPSAFVFEGELNISLLEQSFQSLISRHESLRTSFKEDEQGDVKQFIISIEDINFSVTYKDLTSNNQQSTALNSFIQSDFTKAFDLSQGPLLRASLYQVSSKKYVFTYVMHHIVSDGWSMGILIKEVLAFYNSYLTNTAPLLKPLGLQYKDYAAWQQVQLTKTSLESHKNYWIEQFKGELPVLELTTDNPRPSIKTNKGGTVTKSLNPNTSKSFNTLCQSTGSTLFMGLLASVNTLLYRYTNQEDIIIGSPIAGREHSDLEDQIGFYVNTLALRSQFKGSQSFKELLGQTKEITLGAYEHQIYPFDELVDDLNLQRDMSRNPLFDVMVVLQNNEGQEGSSSMQLGEIKISPYSQTNTSPVSKFDLTFTFAEVEDVIHLQIEYNSDLYHQVSIGRLANHYEKLLSSIVDNPDQRLQELKYLTQEETHQLLTTFNDTKADYPKNKTLVDLFEAQVQKTPNKVALVFEEKEFTYQELNEQSNQLAHYLRATYKIQPDDLIGILLERSEWMLIAILGILKSGGSYVPIDPEYPQERIDYVLRDSNCKALVNREELERFKTHQASCSKNNPTSTTQANNLAYVIYTSGSTGKPKGVMVEHGGVLNRIDWMWRQYGFNSEDVLLQKTNFTFDVSVWEIFMPLCWGTKMVLCNTQDVGSPERILSIIAKQKITCLHFVPSMLNAFISALFPKKEIFTQLQSLTKVITSGEALGLETVKNWYESVSVPIHNLYGPTEASVDVTHYTTGKNDIRIPIGKPIWNTQMYVLNTANDLQPIGVIGEICIGGEGLARGYLNKPELTKEKFVNNPFKAGERMYKTGDLGRWLPDGNIDFIGRKDEQVKIRGYRIELGEIESVLNKHDSIEGSVVIAKTNKEGEKDLVVYITGKEALNAQELRSYLSIHLPAYMVPSYFVQLDSIPLNTNGKIDRKQLPDPSGLGLANGTEYIAPRNETEEQLVKIWEEILDRKHIGIKDNFFELGGHSLKAIRLISKIQKEFNVKIELKDVFIEPTVENIAVELFNRLWHKSSEDINFKSKITI